MNEFDYSELLRVGKNVFINSNSEVKRPHLVEIGDNVAIDFGFYITTQALIGSYVHIGPHVTCIGGESAKLFVGDFTTIAAGARLICAGDEHLGMGLVGPMIPKEYRDICIGGEVILEDFVSVGTNAVIFPGLTVGEGSVIGASSVLMQSSKPWTIYVGNPARPLKPRMRNKMEDFGAALRKGL